MKKDKQWNASVTIFFSLIFLLLLSFSLTFYEAAVKVARDAFELSATRLAIESFFAGYHYPLYESYHIFGREKEKTEDGITYMKNSIERDLREMTTAKKGEISLLRREGADCSVEEIIYLTEQEGIPFFQQAIDYMKYETTTDLFSIFEEKEIEEEKIQVRLQMATEKLEVDKAYAVLEEDFLKLIKLLDGVDVEKYEKYLAGKNISFETQYFAKYFSVYTKEENAVYFEQKPIQEKKNRKYKNPIQEIDDLLLILQQWEAASEAKTNVYEKIMEIEKLENLLLEEKKEKDITKERKEEITILLKEYKKTKSLLQTQREDIEKEIRAYQQSFRVQYNQFLEECKQVLKKCEETLLVLKKIEEKLIVAKEKKDILEKQLEHITLLEAEEIQNWKEGLEEYSKYEVQDLYNFEEMQQSVKQNKTILAYITEMEYLEETSSIFSIRDRLYTWKIQFQSYSLKGLMMYYGELAPATESLKDIEEKLSDLLSNGILSLFLISDVSKQKLEQNELVSVDLQDEQEYHFWKLDSLYEIMDLVQSFWKNNSIEMVYESIVFQNYIRKHFQNYFYTTELGGGGLQYEQEYLLCGKISDDENLVQTAVRIFALRMVTQFSALLCDKEAKKQIEQTAMSIAGVTGMPALKQIAEMLFLVMWSIEEAIIDTATFFAGKEVVVYPNQESRKVMFSEILLFNKKMIKEKLEQEQTITMKTIGYTDYLQTLLFMTERKKLCYRAMDLIQANIRVAGDTDFTIKDCIYEASFLQNGNQWSYGY